MPTGSEPPERIGWGLFSRFQALIERRDPRFGFVSTVLEAEQALVPFESLTTSSMWNMQRHWSIHDLEDVFGMNARARRRGVEHRFVLPRRVAEQRCPLVSSACDYLRLAPVAQPLMVADRRRILVGDATGETVWTSSDPGVVAEAVELYERVWRSAAPAVPAGQEPPYTTRMVEIATRLVNGATDREIARALGVSERTVSADVREMSRRLGARSRTHAIALISGLDG